MKSSDFRKQAREALASNWKKGVLISAAYLLVLFAIEILLSSSEKISLLLNLIFAIANIVISVPISYGLFSAFINLKRRNDVKAFDFLNEGFSNFGKAWKITGHILLKLLIPSIILVVLYFVLIYCLTLFIVSSLYWQPVSSTLFVALVILVVSLLAVSIWLSIKSLLYVFAFPIAYDNPDMKAKDIVLKSKELMKGNRWKYFVLGLTFIGWILLALLPLVLSYLFNSYILTFLSILPLGIGILWLVPYMQISQICFYEYLCSKKEQH